MTRPSPTAPPNMTTVTRAAFVPEPLPADYTGVDLEGRAFAGSQLLGKVVLLDFWAVWCAPCIDAVPKLNRLRAEFPDEAFEVIGYAVFSGPGEDVEAFATDHGINYRVVVGDNDLALDYGVIGYPTYFLIDQQGQRVRKYVGALPGLEDRVIADVRALLGSSP
ncbi:MAG: redoxin domain-containing protein [Acidobacteria bacterium]|nr:redoxin domain-containing protein [Acidobacteriota bacterium]